MKNIIRSLALLSLMLVICLIFLAIPQPKSGIQAHASALETVNHQLGTTTAVITHNAGIASMAVVVTTMSNDEITSIDCNEIKVEPEELEW